MRNLRLVAIVVTLMLVVTFASAQDFKDRPNTPVLDVEKASLFSIIVDFFATQEFSIVGVDRKCSSTAFSGLQNEFKGYWTVQPGTIFELDGVTVCASGNSFIDIYRQNTLGGNWIPAFEHEDWTYFNCLDDGKHQCIVEVYCCPDHGCNTDADCGSGKECITEFDTDPYIPLRDPSTGAYLDSYNYCGEIQGCTGSDISCWRIGGSNQCESSSFPCDYPGYPNCPSTWPYTSLSQCESNIGVQEFCGDGICNNGETCATCPGDCGVCDNGDGDLVGDIRTDGQWEIESGLYIDSISTIKIPLKNFGTKTETINLEAGFYSEDYAVNTAELFSAFPLFSVVPTPNCNIYEKFIQTKQVTLSPGESEIVEIKVVPFHAFQTYDPGVTNLKTEPLIVFYGLYKECLGGYNNEAGTVGRGVMFDYSTYERDIYCSFEILGIGGADLWCGENKIGSCSGSTLNIDNPETPTESCSIPLTADVVNGTVPPDFKLGKKSLVDVKKLALTKKQIETATSADLLASSCLSDPECITNGSETVSCMTIASLRDDGILSEDDSTNFFSNAKSLTKGTLKGASAGILFCGITGALVSGGTLAVPAAIGCASIGALLGGTATIAIAEISASDELVKQLDAENANVVGICTKETTFDLGGFVSKIGKSIKITGDETVDGFIVLGGGIFILFLLRGAAKR